MQSKTSRYLSAFIACAALAGSARAASDLWLHVTVDEADGGTKVTVNLPIALVEKAVPLLPIHRFRADHVRRGHVHWDHDGGVSMSLQNLRELWAEVRDAEDMTFVTVEEDEERVRVWKESGTVFFEVRDDFGDEQVDVRIPVPVVDALLAGDEIDLDKAVQALVAQGGGELVSIRDGDEKVRVWVDDIAESRSR